MKVVLNRTAVLFHSSRADGYNMDECVEHLVMEKNLWIARWCCQDAMPPNFVEKTFTNSHGQNLEICESFLPRNFPTIRMVPLDAMSRHYCTHTLVRAYNYISTGKK